MGCCGGKKKKVTILGNPNSYLAVCTSCENPLTTLGGMKVPIHIVKILVSEKDLNNWIGQGYEFQYERANVRH